jgi:hypothetical protein
MAVATYHKADLPVKEGGLTRKKKYCQGKKITLATIVNPN